MFHYQARPDLLNEKIILVTGAGSGLGRAAAISYAAHGATVILVGKTESKLEATYDTIIAAGGAEPALMAVDLETAGDPEYLEIVEVLANEFGRLDGLLHSAGYAIASVPLQHVTLSAWNKVMQINLTAGFALSKYCLPLLQQAPTASMIFTSSRSGREVRAFWGPYAIAKHGVETLMEIFYQELENTSNIRVNSLNPGPCATALRRAIFPGEDPATRPQPEDLMPLYLYLMGDDSLHENGKQFEAQDARF
jgi:NAD(P)-dependent dehydrogenase (short-subunit alcohol dehydrogenase family)